MQTTCFEIDAHGRAREVELGEIAGRSHDEGSLVWVDVASATREEATGILAGFELQEELIRAILERGHAARTMPFEGGLFFELPLEITGHPPELTSVAFVCCERLLVTIRGEIRNAANWVNADDAELLDLGERTTPSLVSALLVELSIRLRARCVDVRLALTELSERLDDDPESVSVDEITALKRRLFDLDAVSEERTESLETLQSSDRFFRTSPEAAERLNTALRNTAATARRIDRLERRAEALQTRVDAVAQERINRRLSRLTIISAIFLPLTLIAGIYGMNFEIMPELGFPYAYPITLAGMICIALGLLWWFKRGGWMD
jgi:magnesium transporter